MAHQHEISNIDEKKFIIVSVEIATRFPGFTQWWVREERSKYTKARDMYQIFSKFKHLQET